MKEKNNTRKAELLEAENQNRFLSDPTEIRKAVKQGRIETFFLKKEKFQAAIKEDDMTIRLVTDDLKDKKNRSYIRRDD